MTSGRVLARAAVNQYVLRVLGDAGEVFAAHSWLKSYARTAVVHDLADLTFVFADPGLGVLRVWISRAGVGRREVVVEAENRSSLTVRELQVLTLVAAGLSNPQIASLLYIQRKTVTTHLEHILTKLGQASRAGAAAAASERGLIFLPLPAGVEQHPTAPGQLDQLARNAASTALEQWSPHWRAPTPRPRPITIGFLTPSNVDLSHEAADMRRGRQLAISEINTRGGVQGRELSSLTVEADVSSGDSMARGFRVLAEQNVDALVFGYCIDRGNIEGLMKSAAGYGFPVLHASTSAHAADLVRDNPVLFGSVFQLCGTEQLYGPGFLRFLTIEHDRGRLRLSNRRVIVADAFDAIPIATDSFIAGGESAGWEIHRVRTVGVEPHQRAQHILTRLDELDPAALLLATFLDETLLLELLEGLRRRPAPPLIYAIYTPSIAGMLERAGSLAEGMFWATVTGRYTDHFGQRFASACSGGVDPLGWSQAGVHYDAVHLLAQAWGQSRHSSDYPAVLAQLRSTVYRGVDGVYWLGNPNQAPLVYPDEVTDPSLGQAHLVYQVQDGVNRVVSPWPYAHSVPRA